MWFTTLLYKELSLLFTTTMPSSLRSSTTVYKSLISLDFLVSEGLIGLV